MFFRRVEVYTEAQPTSEMMDIIAQIVVEVFSILGITTKEIKQSRLSPYKCITVDLTIGLSEKSAKKLIGRTDIEDALKKLDKLTHEEAGGVVVTVLLVLSGTRLRSDERGPRFVQPVTC